jgi:hypothetical protein
MKKLFYFSLAALTLFEVLNVYFIMPMPGSQQMNSIGVAYFLYSWRWIFRIAFGLMIVAGSISAFKTKRVWLPIIAIIPVIIVVYIFNFRMTADHMFLQPQSVEFKSRAENTLSDSSLVIAVAVDQQARAYPIRYIIYHHQVRDTIAGKPIMVTYCSVCRTGRVYEPSIDGKVENFRLVGMDHFNAMFEDETTKSWWRQVTGEAIAGSLKGHSLPEVESNQYSLKTFFTLHPFGKVMQPETVSINNYDSLARYERGQSKNKLTRTDTVAWRNKSWVLGVVAYNQAKAYDWLELRKKKIINDKIGNTPIVVALAADNKSFIALERNAHETFILRNDSLISEHNKFDFAGRSADGSRGKTLKCYQEFWHSWQQFHPQTEMYKE